MILDNRNGDEGGFEDSLEEDNNADHNAGETAIEKPQNDHQVDDKDIAPFCFFENKTAPNLRVVPSWKPRLPGLQNVVATATKEQGEPPSKKKKAETNRDIPTRYVVGDR